MPLPKIQRQLFWLTQLTGLLIMLLIIFVPQLISHYSRATSAWLTKYKLLLLSTTILTLFILNIILYKTTFKSNNLKLKLTPKLKPKKKHLKKLSLLEKETIRKYFNRHTTELKFKTSDPVVIDLYNKNILEPGHTEFSIMGNETWVVYKLNDFARQFFKKHPKYLKGSDRDQ